MLARLLPTLPLLALLAVLPGCDAVADPGAAADPLDAEAPPEAADAPFEADVLPLVAEAAPEWTAIFQRTSGWLSADGVFSYAVNGVDAPGTADQTSTYLHFSDTLIGEVVGGTVQPGATIVNNTMAFFEGGTPDPQGTQFIYRTDGQGRPRANFIPNTPNAEEGDLYWLGDGFVNQALGGATYIVGAHLRPEAGQPFGLRDLGRNLIVLPPGSTPPFDDHYQIRTPLRIPEGDGRGTIEFGNGIMVNTAEAGAPAPDGYVYVYGLETLGYIKKLLVARVLPEHFEDFSQWRVWDGNGWSRNVRRAAPLTSRVSNELSVSPVGDYYVLVFQLDTISPWVAVRYGRSPVGPFGSVRQVYRCPEVDLDPDFFCYNAKAHPHLSQPGELLVTYNVNSWDFLNDFHKAHTLHPRFIRLRMAE
jgi:hypothetical protein